MGGFVLMHDNSQHQQETERAEDSTRFENGVELGSYAMEGDYALPEETLSGLQNLPTRLRLPTRRSAPYLPETVDLPNAHQLSTQPLRACTGTVSSVASALSAPGQQLKKGLNLHTQQLERLEGVWLGFQAERSQGQWTQMMSDPEVRLTFTQAIDTLHQASGDHGEAQLAQLATDAKFTNEVGALSSALLQRDALYSEYQSWKAKQREEKAERNLKRLSKQDKQHALVLKDVESVAKSLLSGGPISGLRTLASKVKPRVMKKLSSALNAAERKELRKTLKVARAEKERLRDESYQDYLQAHNIEIDTIKSGLHSLLQQIDAAAKIEETRERQVGNAIAGVNTSIEVERKNQRRGGLETFSELEHLYWALKTSGEEITALAHHMLQIMSEANALSQCEQGQAIYREQFAAHMRSWNNAPAKMIRDIKQLSSSRQYLETRQAEFEALKDDLNVVNQWFDKDSSERLAITLGSSIGDTITRESAS